MLGATVAPLPISEGGGSGSGSGGLEPMDVDRMCAMLNAMKGRLVLGV